MKQNLYNYWIKSGLIKDKRVLAAYKKVPRENFILDPEKERAYRDHPLPIGYGQTISQPSTVMIMTQALDLKLGDKVLEIGAGSGYQAALIGTIVGKNGRVYSTEVVSELAKFARENLKSLKIKNVEVFKKDGSLGLKKYSPYDKIIVTAACPEIPKPLIEQLKVKGILVAPVGPLYAQEMIRITKKEDGVDEENLGSFIFVPLKGEHGYKE